MPWRPVERLLRRRHGQPGQEEDDQAHLCLALHGVANGHVDRYAIDMLNTILGEGIDQRAFHGRSVSAGGPPMKSTAAPCTTGTPARWSSIAARSSPKQTAQSKQCCKNSGRLRDSIPKEDLDNAIEFAVGRLDLAGRHPRSDGMARRTRAVARMFVRRMK